MNPVYLIPLDGSKESESALSYGKLLATRHSGSLHLLRCYEPPSAVYSLPGLENLASEVLADHRLETMMLEYLERIRGQQVPDITCDVEVKQGDPATEILAASDKADVTILSRHGRGGAGRWLIGGVAGKVVRSCTKPILVVPSALPESPKIETIMVCLDGSPAAEHALKDARKLADSLGAQIVLYRYVPLIYSAPELLQLDLEDARSYLAKQREDNPVGVKETLARTTHGGSDIAEAAEDLGADLIVIGSHGRRGVFRWLLGSVAEHTVHHARTPVLVVHAPS